MTKLSIKRQLANFIFVAAAKQTPQNPPDFFTVSQEYFTTRCMFYSQSFTLQLLHK